jgi:hypothetical protein
MWLRLGTESGIVTGKITANALCAAGKTPITITTITAPTAVQKWTEKGKSNDLITDKRI